MRVLITGGTGVVGKEICARLVEQGDEVRVIGIEAEAQIDGADYICCDIMDYAQVREQVRGCEAIIHLAAIPNPRTYPGQQTFQVNVAGTYNVFEAAAQEGIQRIVQASSINALGCAWSPNEIAPEYLPIDEAHPTFTTDAYSFSKQMIEAIGDYYWRRDGISSVALRFPAVLRMEYLQSERFHEGRAAMTAVLDELIAQPDDQQQARLAVARQRALEFRHQRLMEYPSPPPNLGSLASPDDMLWKAYCFDRFNFWAFVDERDSAQSMAKALTAEFEGSHALFINADQNSLGYDSETLVRLFFPDAGGEKRALQGAETLVSIEKARNLIGFEPEYNGKA